MALTVKLVDKSGKLAIIDDEFGKIGTGRAKPSSQPGYITLTMRIKNPTVDMKRKKVMVNDFIVLRVPINWLELGDIHDE